MTNVSTIDGIKISGPSSITYLYNEKTNQKVILLGELHGDHSASCDEGDKTIIEYLELLSNTDLHFDVFLETDIPSKNKLFKKHRVKKQLKLLIANNEQRGYMDDLINYFSDVYKSKKNVRFHMTDIRRANPTIMYAQHVYQDIIPKVMEFYAKCNCNIAEICDNIIELSLEYLNLIMAHKYYISDDKQSPYISKRFITEITKLKKYNLKYYNAIVDIMLKAIDIYAADAFKEEREENMSEVENLYYKGQNAHAYINDVYFVARILKGDDYKKIISYVGQAHVYIISEYLVSCDFKILYTTNMPINYESSYRCLTVPISFYNFLKN